MHEGVVDTEVRVGVPSPQEPWGMRLKLYTRAAHNWFKQEKLADVMLTIPLPLQRVQFAGQELSEFTCSSLLEVVRVVPRSAIGALQDRFGVVLSHAVNATTSPTDVVALYEDATELGLATLISKCSERALIVAAGSGKASVLFGLLDLGVPPTVTVAKAAEEAGELNIAHSVFLRMEPQTEPEQLLIRAMEHGLPLLAAHLLTLYPRILDELSTQDEMTAKTAHAVGAWSVLAAMLDRGGQMPVPTQHLLNYALRAEHVGLAESCLLRCDNLSDVDDALTKCLRSNVPEIARMALESQWRVRASQWSLDEVPGLLFLECGCADEAAECGVCFDPLYKSPGVLLDTQGVRVCQHLICEDCAQHVQDEAAKRHRTWRLRQDMRPPPPGPVCPLCRAPFDSSARLPDPTVDPRGFFRLSCVPGQAMLENSFDKMVLTETVALGVLCAVLPLSGVRLAPRLGKDLWPRWCGEDAVLAEDRFLRPGGMLAWLCDHLLEWKVEEQRGKPPGLHEPRAWFEYFDYERRRRLTKAALVHGVAKVHCVAKTNSVSTIGHDTRNTGMQMLLDLVSAQWDDTRWADGVPLSDFEAPGGLAARLLAVFLDGREVCPSRVASMHVPSVEDALARSRLSDLQERRCRQAWLNEREEARRALTAVAATRSRGEPAAQPGAQANSGTEVLASRSSNTETQARSEAGDGTDVTTHSAYVRVRCPFCGNINLCRAAAGLRVLCATCQGVFAVPELTTSL
eukprot:TRINITY_DN31736_c0_g1_i1.p1 TRINITY_DN31736_c0_g1~~TRINITY_DN31736_c0_g1_i1.p1  ORF type:complete len:860 (-),score=113.66 TRINITY_DN31736_c0_g1_i1:14-2239(-)